MVLKALCEEGSDEKHCKLVIGGVVGAGIVVLIIFFVQCYCCFCRQKKDKKKDKYPNLADGISSNRQYREPMSFYGIQDVEDGAMEEGIESMRSPTMFSPAQVPGTMTSQRIPSLAAHDTITSQRIPSLAVQDTMTSRRIPSLAAQDTMTSRRIPSLAVQDTMTRQRIPSLAVQNPPGPTERMEAVQKDPPEKNPQPFHPRKSVLQQDRPPRKSLNTTIVQRTKQKSRNKSVRKPKHNPPHKSMAPQNGMRLEKTLDPRLDPAAIRITEVERKRPDFTSRRRTAHGYNGKMMTGVTGISVHYWAET